MHSDPRIHELVVVSGPDSGRSVELLPGRHTLGRSPACGIRIDDAQLQPHHAMVVWNPPILRLEPLAGTGSVEGHRIRVGRSVCDVRLVDGIAAGTRDETGAKGQTRMFHRTLVHQQVEELAPQRVSEPVEPSKATPPSWNSVVTGMVSGVAIAALSGQWYFAMFSLVTAAVSGFSWLVRVLGVRRKVRVWRSEIQENDVEFTRQCQRHAESLARRRRMAHPDIPEVRAEICRGGTWFWRDRTLDRVSIGRGSRAITVAEGAPVMELHEIPVLIDVAAGSFIGVYGSSARNAVAALIARMAAQVGPSDWSLAVVGDSRGRWRSLELLPHFTSGQVPGGDNGGAGIDSRSASSARHLVVVLEDLSLATRSSALIQRFFSSPMTVIVSAMTRSELPPMCTVTVDSDDEETDGISSETLQDICEEIAQWRDPDAVGAGVPASLDFAELHEGMTLDASRIRDVWRSRRGLGPKVDVGLGAQGRVVLELDRDGPHGVVIGTTGSGKSELLRQLVLSLALSGSPEDVSMLLIDYKGGSAFDVCTGMPHVVGVITDLDIGLAERVLLGLEAELKRREAVLRASGARDVADYIQLSDGAHMPRLVIIVDELAAMRAEIPEFIPALASVAQRGRSLGLHLFVASQRAAAFATDVLANASIRIALRVQSVGDSLEVVGTDRAALIDRRCPGRMVLRVGSEQSQDVQASFVSDGAPQVVSELVRAGEGFQIPHRPWSNPLPDFIHRTDDCAPGVVGISDLVRAQRQIPYSFRFDRHLMIIGGLGRTNAIRTAVRSLSRGLEAIDVIVISCRKTGDSGCAGVGHIVDIADRERLARTIKFCEDRARTSSMSSTGIRRMVLAVDDADVWRSLSVADRGLGLLWDGFERIVAGGPASGVVCIVTSSSEQGIPATIRSRMDASWSGTDRAGVFDVSDRIGADGLEVQLFWEDPARMPIWVSNPGIESSLRVLPDVITSSRKVSAYAIEADSWEEIPVLPHESLRSLILGSPGSGISTSILSLANAWSAVHGCSRIVEADPADPSWIARLESWSSDPNDDEILVVIDDVHRHGASAASLASMVADPKISARLSIIAGTTGRFVRTHPEHWIQSLRRARTGFLLGRSIDEDCDLVGLHAAPLHMYRITPGRGLWVEGGVARGIVQFLHGIPRSDG